MTSDLNRYSVTAISSLGHDLIDGPIGRAKRQWEAVVDTLPQLICMVDGSGRIVRTNRTFERWGLGGVKSAIGEDFHQRLHPYCADPDCYLLQHVDMVRMANFATPANGLRVYDEQLLRYLRIHLSSLNQTGQRLGGENRFSLFVAEDVTCRAGLDRKASASEEKLQLLVDSVSDLIVQHSSDGTMHYLSPASITLLGSTPQALLGASLFDLMHENDRDVVATRMTHIPTGESVESNTFRLRRSVGDWRWVEARTHAMVNTAGNYEYVTIMRDVSDRPREEGLALEYRKKLEHEVAKKTSQLTMVVDMLKQQIEENDRDWSSLEALGRRYTSLVENTLTGIYLQQKNRVVFCNQRFAEIFGYSRDEISGMELRQLLDDVNEPSALPDVDQGAYITMSSANVVEGWRYDGTSIWMKMSQSRLENDEGVFVLGNVIDVSEQVRVQDELRRSEKAMHHLSSLLIAAQENERKRIANELHDGIGQRLSAIKFSVEDVLRSAEGSASAQSLERLHDVVGKIRDTIEEVRRTSMDLRPSILDDLGLVATINWFCREFSAMFPWIEVIKSVGIDEEALREELKVVIFRVMQEAFHNISKHASAQRVDISLGLRGDMLVLKIHDDGCGFILDAKVLNGPSLGLKSMRERAELMGGAFDIRSGFGTGTRIEVCWPGTVAFSEFN